MRKRNDVFDCLVDPCCQLIGDGDANALNHAICVCFNDAITLTVVLGITVHLAHVHPLPLILEHGEPVGDVFGVIVRLPDVFSVWQCLAFVDGLWSSFRNADSLKDAVWLCVRVCILDRIKHSFAIIVRVAVVDKLAVRDGIANSVGHSVAGTLGVVVVIWLAVLERVADCLRHSLTGALRVAVVVRLFVNSPIVVCVFLALVDDGVGLFVSVAECDTVDLELGLPVSHPLSVFHSSIYKVGLCDE